MLVLSNKLNSVFYIRDLISLAFSLSTVSYIAELKLKTDTLKSCSFYS